ncbi:MAG: hypothetical protein JSV88_07485 [Candidatus Aminicenantes bacterium]|nr:MAG: hypothetical protein JSV88_07485 [Candidatus Aminicenantes bacterium]
MRILVFLSILLISVVLLYPALEVKNADKPLKGNWDFKPSLVWEIDRVGDETFGRVNQILVNSKGVLYVNESSKINYIIDENGKFVKRFGRKGEGPGEIVNQKDSFLLKDRVVIADQGKLHFFTMDGEYIESVMNNYGKLPPMVFINESEFISAPYKPAFGTDQTIGQVSRINLKSGQETNITEFRIFQGGFARMGDRRVIWIVFELIPRMILGYDNNRIYYGLNDTYKINVADLSGKLLYTFSVDREKKRITPKEKKDLFKGSLKLPQDVVKALINSHPDELTYFTNIEIHNGFIYVFLADLGHPNQKEIDIFSMDGKYQYRSCIRFDKSLSIHGVYTISGNNILIEKDNLYIVLERYNIILCMVKKPLNELNLKKEVVAYA